MNAIAFLEALASDASASLGVSIQTARALVRLALVDVAISFEIPADRIAEHLDALAAPAAEAAS